MMGPVQVSTEPLPFPLQMMEIPTYWLALKTFRKAIALTGTPQVFSITLKEDIHSLETVTISAGSFTAADNSRRTVFRAVDIATTAGATADIAGALNTCQGRKKLERAEDYS